MENLLITMFYDVDNFCKRLERYYINHLIPETKNRKILSLCTSEHLALSEIMTIVMYFHHSHYRTFKHYYKELVCGALAKYFPNIVSYNRFVELMKETLVPLLLYTHKFRLGKTTGISFIDSTTLDVCHNRRIHSHKVFDGLAERGKSSTGWFYGFKLHLTVNDKGEILGFCITPGNTDDRDVDVVDKITKGLFGKLFGDKGYISQKLFQKLYSKGIFLVTKLKKNMKNKLMLLEDRLLLRKRAIIESVNDFLKNICQIEHTRHRSPVNFLVNLVAGIAAYSFLPSKPSLDFIRTDN